MERSISRSARRRLVPGVLLGLAAAAAAQTHTRPADPAGALPVDRAALERLRESIGPAAVQTESPHFVLLSTTAADRGADLLARIEPLFDAHVAWARTMDLRVERPRGKLAILYFQTADHLERGLAALGVNEPAPLGGYVPGHNCAAFFDLDTYEPVVELRRRVEQADPAERAALRDRLAERLVGLRGTLVQHEAAHLIQANLGLIGDTGRAPAWLAEGLATLFEPGVGHAAPVAPVNAYRLHEFRTLYASPDDLGDLAALLTADEAWSGAGQYPLAWAVVRYLYEERRAVLAELLRKVAADEWPQAAEQRRRWLEARLGPIDAAWRARLFEATVGLKTAAR